MGGLRVAPCAAGCSQFTGARLTAPRPAARPPAAPAAAVVCEGGAERRLILMRHAKSSWDFEHLSDHDRPLNGRGRKSAVAMGRALVAAGWAPDLILSSDSARTRETWARMIEGEHEIGHARIRWLPSFYGVFDRSAAPEISEGIRGLATDDDQVLLALGHNCGWECALQELTGDETLEIKTADAALLSSPAGSWGDALVPGGFKLEALIKSRDAVEEFYNSKL